MEDKIIDGKQLVAHLEDDLKVHISNFEKAHHSKLTLAVILVGNDPASSIYVANKKRSCERLGITSISIDLPATVSETELLKHIDALNSDKNIHGILIQLPLPQHINAGAILNKINPLKDVDGFHPENMGLLACGRPRLRPCTPFGIMKILEHYHIHIPGKKAVIVGASNIVGRPMAFELLNKGATITICHSKTQDLKAHVNQADILVVATGVPELIKGDWIKPGAWVFDVGINRLADGSLIGDVEFEKALSQVGKITPVPGGVGPLTVFMLLHNTLSAAKLQLENAV